MVDHEHVSSGIENVRTSHDRWLRFVPCQHTRTSGVPILVALTGPRCFVSTRRYIPPDQRLSVSCAFIRALAVSHGEEQKEGAANKKRLNIHAKMDTQIIAALRFGLIREQSDSILKNIEESARNPVLDLNISSSLLAVHSDGFKNVTRRVQIK